MGAGRVRLPEVERPEQENATADYQKQEHVAIPCPLECLWVPIGKDQDAVGKGETVTQEEDTTLGKPSQSGDYKPNQNGKKTKCQQSSVQSSLAEGRLHEVLGGGQARRGQNQ